MSSILKFIKVKGIPEKIFISVLFTPILEKYIILSITKNNIRVHAFIIGYLFLKTNTVAYIYWIYVFIYDFLLFPCFPFFHNINCFWNWGERRNCFQIFKDWISSKESCKGCKHVGNRQAKFFSCSYK